MPCVVVSSYTPVLSLWNAKNWSCPAVERLVAPVSIIAPMNFVEVYYKVILYANGSVSVGNTSVMILMVMAAYLYTGIPWQDVISLLSISPQISCLGRAFFFRMCSNRGSQLVNAVG
jgi:hypothetical protein